MVNHTLHAFDEFLVRKSDPKRVFVIAHSMGGACTTAAVERFAKWALPRIVAIAYTDGFPDEIADPRLRQWAADRSINWAQSKEEVNARLPDGVVSKTRSAGTRDHPLTTLKAFPFIWEWFDLMAQAAYGADPQVPTVVALGPPAASQAAPSPAAALPEAPAPAPPEAPAAAPPEAPAGAGVAPPDAPPASNPEEGD
jgi:hypothetical protein